MSDAQTSSLRQYDQRAAVVTVDGEAVITFAELDQRSTAVAELLRGHGVQQGDHIAILMRNEPAFYEVTWAAQRMGLYYTPINWHLTADEAAYILGDCQAKAIISSLSLSDLALEVTSISPVPIKLMSDAPPLALEAGWTDLTEALESHQEYITGKEVDGAPMLYSSGTTARPKGVIRPLTGTPFGTLNAFHQRLTDRYGFSVDSSYLCVAPLYHAAPLLWSTAAQLLGTTTVLASGFDAEDTLRYIEQFKITHVQMVPTMFVRMLRLSKEIRMRYDLSSLQYVIHAAAPCPPDVKVAMLEWLGPVVYEYYGGSEGNGVCAIGPDEWLEHHGSVGKAIVGTVHIVDDNGNEGPAGDIGTVYFEGGPRFEYFGDPEKTNAAFDHRGWSTLGDIGYLDDDGYLYLTDRKSFTIISGGVNIYPQEIENVLSLHPEVADVGVIGLPDEEFGERVVAVVLPEDWGKAGPLLEAALIEFCRSKLASFKCPREVRFGDVPRSEAGKIVKRTLRARYTDESSASNPS